MSNTTHHQPAPLDPTIRAMRQPPPLELLYRVWDQVSLDDRLRFLIEALTRRERLAVLQGLDDEDDEDEEEAW